LCVQRIRPVLPLNFSLVGDKSIMDAEIPEEKNSRKWTPDEDERLAQLVEKYQGKCWKKVAEELKGRTDVQCLHRCGSPKSLGPLQSGSWAVKEVDPCKMGMILAMNPETPALLYGLRMARNFSDGKGHVLTRNDLQVAKSSESRPDQGTMDQG
jgi:hypothetical protein